MITVILVGSVLALGAAAGMTALTAHRERQEWQQQLAAHESQLAAAQVASSTSRADIERHYDAAVRALTAQVARAEEVYRVTNNRVVEDDLRWELLFATNDAKAVLATPPTYLSMTRTVAAISTDGTFVDDSRPGGSFIIMTGTTPAVGELQAATRRITEALTAVQQSRLQWKSTTAAH